MEKYRVNIIISLQFYGIKLEVAKHFVNDKEVFTTIVRNSPEEKIETFALAGDALNRFKELITGVDIKSGFFKNL